MFYTNQFHSPPPKPKLPLLPNRYDDAYCQPESWLSHDLDLSIDDALLTYVYYSLSAKTVGQSLRTPHMLSLNQPALCRRHGCGYLIIIP